MHVSARQSIYILCCQSEVHGLPVYVPRNARRLSWTIIPSLTCQELVQSQNPSRDRASSSLIRLSLDAAMQPGSASHAFRRASQTRCSASSRPRRAEGSARGRSPYRSDITRSFCESPEDAQMASSVELPALAQSKLGPCAKLTDGAVATVPAMKRASIGLVMANLPLSNGNQRLGWTTVSEQACSVHSVEEWPDWSRCVGVVRWVPFAKS